MTNRSVLSVVLLSIFTCGIYQIYWMCVTTNELNQEDAQEPLMHYLLAWLLGIVTCGIYFIYWHYKFYKKMDFVTGKDNCLLSFLLSIFISTIIGVAISQDSMNKLSEI